MFKLLWLSFIHEFNIAFLKQIFFFQCYTICLYYGLLSIIMFYSQSIFQQDIWIDKRYLSMSINPKRWCCINIQHTLMLRKIVLCSAYLMFIFLFSMHVSTTIAYNIHKWIHSEALHIHTYSRHKPKCMYVTYTKRPVFHCC